MSVTPQQDNPTAVDDGDPAPFEVLNPEGKSPVLLVCDHASRAIPKNYGLLGLDEAMLWRHIAWDIGAADVTRRLSAAIDATAVLAGASRLLIDVNRQFNDPSLIPARSDGIDIPGNKSVDDIDRQRRIKAWHRSYHDEIARQISIKRRMGVVPGILSVHSFTPVMNEFERPWHIGVLWNAKSRIAEPLMDRLKANSSLVVGDNQPYTAEEPYGYTIHVHGEDNGLPFVAVEIRQDLIDTHHGAESWANLMADATNHMLAVRAPFEAG